MLGSLLFLWLKSRVGLVMILLSSAAVGVAYLGMSQAGTLAVACAFSVSAAPATASSGWRS